LLLSIYQVSVYDVCLKIAELMEKMEQLREETLSRKHEIEAVVSSLASFKSRAEELTGKLMTFKENVKGQVTKPLSADVNVIKVELQLIKVCEIFVCFFYIFLHLLLKTRCKFSVSANFLE